MVVITFCCVTFVLQVHIVYSSTYKVVNSGLHEVPPDIPSDTTVINIHGNSINNINPTDFQHIQNLQELYLHENLLTKWPNISGHLKPDLVRMHLGGNLITEVSESDTAGYTSLENILLYQNMLTEFPELGDAKRSLIFLNIAYNQIEYIDKNCFKGMDKLTKLVMHGNQLSQIPDFHYLNLTRFEKINIKVNPIKMIWPWTIGRFGATQTDALQMDLATVTCDCRAIFHAQFLLRNTHLALSITCDSPVSLQGLRVDTEVPEDDLVCQGE